jgi:hypothetical protein
MAGSNGGLAVPAMLLQRILCADRVQREGLATLLHCLSAR